MSNCYILTLGKNLDVCNALKDSEPSLQFYTNCYYDWFGIYPIRPECDIPNSETITSLLKDSAYKEIQKTKETFLDTNRKVLQNLVLMTDDEENVLKNMFNDPESLSIVYITFLRLSKNFKQTEYSKEANREQTSPHIVNIIQKYNSNGITVGLYNSFDYCDYIIVCNGQKIELNSYMKLLQELRSITVSAESEKREAMICNITSLYGYIPHQLNLNTEKVSGIIKEECFTQNDSISLLGHYNRLRMSSHVTFKSLFDSIESTCYSSDQAKIYIGVPSEGVPNFPSVNNGNNKLLKKAKKTYTKHKALLLKKSENAILKGAQYFKSCILGSFEEIYKMICSMLNKGVSEYYVLSFYESFFGLLSFITNKILSADERTLFPELTQTNISNEDCSKQRLELIFDITNSYFSHLQVLASGMLHDEREVVQTAPYQLMCFDMPPKLIAFYTSMAYLMLDALKKIDNSSNSRYTIMLVPNFKSDIFVQSLYDNQDYENEENILVLHVNEETIYDIPLTLQIIAHEIAHHVGQTRQTRQHRAQCYVKCFLAKICSIVWDSLDEDGKNIISNLFAPKNFTNSTRNECFFSFVEALFTEWTEQGILPTAYDADDWFYTDRSIQFFIDEIKKARCDKREKMEEGFKKAAKKTFEKEPSILLAYEPGPLDFLEKNNNITIPKSFIDQIKNYSDPSSYSIDFMVNLVSNAFFSRFDKKVMDELNRIDIKTGHTKAFETVIYVFREGLADINMLYFVYDKISDHLNAYKESLENDATTVGDALRSLAVRISFTEHLDGCKETQIVDPFEQYVIMSAITHFKHYQDSIEKALPFKTAAEIIRSDINIIRSTKSSTELLSVIERTIHEYTNTLEQKNL